jgi:hypothetical protein
MRRGWQYRFVTPARGRRGWLIGVLLAIALSTGSVAAGYSSASPHSPGISATARAALLRAATALATMHGDRHPYDIEAVRTTHRKAERMLCGNCELYVVPPGAPVYVVAMRGHFNCSRCSGPPHIHRRFDKRFAPATVITLQFLDPEDLRNFVFGYNVPYPHLKAAGTPVRL